MGWANRELDSSKKNSVGYDFLGMQVFTSGTTWTPTSGTRAVFVIVTGGGASGGTDASSAGVGGAGGAGATEMSFLTEKVLVNGTETVTIGSGGGAVSADSTTGTAGGTSSFGSHVSVPGGAGGITTGQGGAGGIASGSDLNIDGGSGASGIGITVNTDFQAANGGCSYWGPGGEGGTEDFTAGKAGDPYGSGGGSPKHNATSGAGKSGICVVYEYG